jgi:3alpha(or 20beta)-hydroxysteroid dehydrogenase
LRTEQPDTHELAGRVALVTGAARGQGRAIALRLASAGASVIAGDLLEDHRDSLAEHLGTRGLVGRLDVRDGESWSAFVERGVGEFGGLDILVNNAGVLRRMALAEESAEEFESVWRVNCLGSFLGMKAVLPYLRLSDCAAIVNTSSAAGVTAWSRHGAYVSSKWALRGLTKAAALELAADGIRVNGVIPGPIDTPMVVSPDDPEARNRLGTLPLGRIGTPEDVAEAVLFLVSNRSAFITGSDITVDGGQLAGTIVSPTET